ncbi:DNA topoisomerase IV subunit B, partial [Streptomyces sp. SID11233]|nr:DNA topoisomerase IV subunit B [Streptomyces sp. SID11233]
MAFLNKGLTIKLTDERESAKATVGADSAEVVDAEEPPEARTVTYHYEGGIVDFVKYLNSRKGEVIHPSVIDVE